MAQPRLTNGLDVQMVQRLIKEMEEDPQKMEEMASSVWKTRLRWVAGFQSVAFARELSPITMDEPDWMAGENRGLSPHEALLAALGASLVAGFVANTSALGVTVDSLEVEVEGKLDLPAFYGIADGNPGYEDIRVKIFVESDTYPEVLEAIHNKVVKLCPVTDTLRRPVNVSTSLHIVK